MSRHHTSPQQPGPTQGNTPAADGQAQSQPGPTQTREQATDPNVATQPGTPPTQPATDPATGDTNADDEGDGPDPANTPVEQLTTDLSPDDDAPRRLADTSTGDGEDPDTGTDTGADAAGYTGITLGEAKPGTTRR